MKCAMCHHVLLCASMAGSEFVGFLCWSEAASHTVHSLLLRSVAV